MRTFDPETLDRARLSKLADLLLDGARIEPIDARSVLALTADLEPHGVQAFGSSQRFLDRGLGFAVVMGDRVASQASSYAASRERVEVAIATHPEHRGRGLAAAVAARMLLHCLETGRRPEWSAANPVSKRLARRLGYAPGPLCDAVLVRNAVRG